MSGTATLPRSSSDPIAVQGWAVLALDELRLALPQRDVRQFELAADLEAPKDNLPQASGQLTAGRGELWPVYRLDSSLQLTRAADGSRSLCVFFQADGPTRGLLCDRVWSLSEDADLVVEPMPGCLKGPPSPATGLARFQDRIAMVTNRVALSHYLAQLLGEAHAER